MIMTTITMIHASRNDTNGPKARLLHMRNPDGSGIEVASSAVMSATGKLQNLDTNPPVRWFCFLFVKCCWDQPRYDDYANKSEERGNGPPQLLRAVASSAHKEVDHCHQTKHTKGFLLTQNLWVCVGVWWFSKTRKDILFVYLLSLWLRWLRGRSHFCPSEETGRPKLRRYH